MFEKLEKLVNRADVLLEMADSYEEGQYDQEFEDRVVQRVLEQTGGKQVGEQQIRQTTQDELNSIFEAMLATSELYGTIGPHPQGDYHSNPHWGPHFKVSQSVRLISSTVDAQEAGDFTTEIWEFDSDQGRQGSEPVHTQQHTVTQGLNRIELDIVLEPGSYQISRPEPFALRRAKDWDGWNEVKHPAIQMIHAGSEEQQFKSWLSYYHYYFDLTVGPVTSSTGEQAIRQTTRDVAERYADELGRFVERGNKALDNV